LERPLSAHLVGTDSDPNDGAREIERIVLGAVLDRTGAGPRGVRLLATDAGRVIFLTLSVSARISLVDAHQLGSELEDEIRRQIPDIADVVVHTEASED
jgi:divalent metal cation (Fe/Co/Zn/Cd) transporter